MTARRSPWLWEAAHLGAHLFPVSSPSKSSKHRVEMTSPKLLEECGVEQTRGRTVRSSTFVGPPAVSCPHTTALEEVAPGQRFSSLGPLYGKALSLVTGGRSILLNPTPAFHKSANFH